MTQHTPPRAAPANRTVEPPLRRTALALMVAGCFNAAHANPVAPQVVNGQATFNQQGNLFTITNTPNTIINWQSFSVNAGEITRFVQQNAGSSVLNRITGQDPSKILGSLQSNGKVLLINPNGVLFGRDARVDVAGLVASSLALSNQDFLAGKMNFKAGDTAGAVINQGAINAGSGGQILLIAPSVENSGIITAPNGDVMLAAGHTVQLADAANPDLRVVLSAPADQAINIGQVVAQGGRIGMAGALLNQRGVLSANSAVVGENGKIVLKASGKTLLESGSVTSATATGAAGKGGEITVLGDQVGMLGNARVDVSGATGGGTVLLGGDYQGKNPAIVNARQVAVGKDATIVADAMESGDGGKVIVWGNETARVFGNISARGGAASGNGGLVETSGHYLAVDGIRVDTSSRRGKGGNWLLDPFDITVVQGASGELGSVDQFDEAPLFGTAIIGATTISNASSNVTLQATHRINFNAAIDMVNAGIGITATAGEAINVNAPITTQGGAVILSANDASGGFAYGASGNINLTGAIGTAGGDVTLAGANIIGMGAVVVGNGNLSLKSNLAGGSILLSGSGDQLAGSGSAGQAVLLQGDIINFSGGLNFGGAAGLATLTIKPLVPGLEIDLGSKPLGVLGLTADELNNVAVHTVNIGDAGSGNITISAPLNLAHQQQTDGIKNLNLETGGSFTSANKLTMLQADSALQVTAGVGITVANGGGLAAGATVSLVADNMSLGGAAQSISAGTGTGTVNLQRLSNGGSIEIGSAGEDSTVSLGLTDSELKTVSAPTLTIGRQEYAGALNLQGALDLGTSSNLDVLELRTGGEINLNGALAVPKNLTIAAFNGAQNSAINASGIVRVGGAFVLEGGNWVQNNASLPAFSANSFRIDRGSFLRVKGGNGDLATPYQIADVYGLQGIDTQSYTKNYSLVANIDASGTANWNLDQTRSGFAPLFSGDEFTYGGIFDGGNHSISGLTINGGANPPYFGSGLFSQMQGGTIRNLALVGGSVSGGNNVGAVVGNNDGGMLSNVSSSMAVTGIDTVGGLVGVNSGTISTATATGNVTALTKDFTGGSSVGGLVGSNNSGGKITAARATGVVDARGTQVGGLAGNNEGDISQAYATGAVGGAADVGGLVGRNAGTITDAYATGSVGLANSAVDVYSSNLGGVIGLSQAGSSASNLYFSGTVSGAGFASGTVGAVVGSAEPGARVGSAFFGYQTAGTDRDQGGATGLTTQAMQMQGSFGGFNFGDNAVWRIYEGHTTPLLKAFLTPLQVSASGAASKVYDGTVASVGALGYVGLLNGDTAPSGTASYGNAVNVGSYALGGLWSTQYDISYAGASTMTITPRAVSVILSGSKVYDGQLGFAGSTLSLGNTISGDTVGVTGTAQFVDKNAGTGKAVNISGLALTGNGLGNYSLADTASGTADISRATLALGSVSAANKTYDGSTSASFGGSLTGVIGADQVQLSGVLASFTDKNVGVAKDVNYSVTGSNLSGNDAANYVLTAAAGKTSAAITARTLNLGFTGVSKTYDGSAAATVTMTDDRIANDVLMATAVASFADKNAGVNKSVTVQNASLSGTDAGNYVLASTTGATSATIAQRALALGFTAAGKTYDGTTAAAVAVTDDRVAGDLLTATATGAFADKNAGVNKTVTVQNASLSGTDAANYVLSSTIGATSATIAQRALALGFTAAGKTYDGTTAAAVAVTDDRVAGDVMTATASGVFADKNAGINKSVTVQNASLAGTDAANYVLSSTNGATSATIAQRALALGFTAAGKTYDGTTAATVGVTDDRVAGDVLTATASGVFADKNAGINKAVTVQNASLSGTDAANYVLSSTNGATSATIAQRALALGFTAAGKTYDGTTAATVGVTDDRVAGDVLTATASGVFADKNAGVNKTVTVQNASLAGTDAANYMLSSTTGATSATIAQRALALGFTAAGKTYDGTTAAAVAVTDDRVAGDVMTATASGVFADKNAGINKAVTVQNASLSGTDAANYVLSSTTGATSATIAQRALALGFTANGKTYDGTTAATVGVTDNRVAGDVLTATATGSFADKNAGINKSVTVQNASLAGTDAGNYVLSSTTGATSATIAQRVLTLGFTGNDKVYDGSTGARVAISDDRLAGDAVSASASASFADKNAGSGKAVAVQGVALSGADAGNYRLLDTAGVTTASIARAALTLNTVSASDKVYDGTQAASVSGTVAGVIGQDAVSLAGGSGVFADRNFGTGKAVAVSGFQLAGSDAGNYTLASNSGVAQANIAQRALSTWIGASGGLWSDTANWEGGVAPIGSNVLAADFAASTGTVVYSAAAGDTVLNSFTSRGGLNLTGGSLLVNGALSAANYVQSGGLLGGAGNVTVSNSFSQSGGAINVGGNLAITQASGDLRFAALTANAINLSAGTGAISQSGALVASSLATQSQTGTVLNDAGNRMKSFSASNSGAGGIALTTTSAPDLLVLGSLATGSGDVRIDSTGGVESHAITSNGGNVTLIAHSPVNVQGAISGNDVTIDASTDVRFGDGARINATRTVAVTAGTGVTFAGAATVDVLAAGGINVLAKNGDLTAADTVRINSRSAPVTLLAPNGTVRVPASVMVGVPVTTPVIPPATVSLPSNAVAALADTYNPLNQVNTSNTVSSPLLTNTTSTESTKEATDESKSGIKKSYCN